MKIIVDKQTKTVLYADEALSLTEEGATGDGFRDPRTTLGTADLFAIDSLPMHWRGGYFTYDDGVWALTSCGSDGMAAILPERKRERRDEVNALLAQKIQSGVSYTFPDSSIGVIQTRNDVDFRNIQGLSSAAMALIISGQSTANMVIRTGDDVTHTITAAQMTALGLAVMAYVQNLYNRSWAHKDAIEACATVAEVDAYDISAGW